MGVNWNDGARPPQQPGVYLTEYVFPHLGRIDRFYCYCDEQQHWHYGDSDQRALEELRARPVAQASPLRWAMI